MPRIDPHQLLTTLDVLLSVNGGIKSSNEVTRLVALMKKFSKKLVSKCIYVQILKATPSHLLEIFLECEGWDLLNIWFGEAIRLQNWPFCIELIHLFAQCPISANLLKCNVKVNQAPRLINQLRNEVKLDANIRLLASDVYDKWVGIVSPSFTPSSNNTLSQQTKPSNQPMKPSMGRVTRGSSLRSTAPVMSCGIDDSSNAISTHNGLEPVKLRLKVTTHLGEDEFSQQIVTQKGRKTTSGNSINVDLTSSMNDIKVMKGKVGGILPSSNHTSTSSNDRQPKSAQFVTSDSSSDDSNSDLDDKLGTKMNQSDFGGGGVDDDDTRRQVNRDKIKIHSDMKLSTADITKTLLSGSPVTTPTKKNCMESLKRKGGSDSSSNDHSTSLDKVNTIDDNQTTSVKKVKKTTNEGLHPVVKTSSSRLSKSKHEDKKRHRFRPDQRDEVNAEERQRIKELAKKLKDEAASNSGSKSKSSGAKVTTTESKSLDSKMSHNGSTTDGGSKSLVDAIAKLPRIEKKKKPVAASVGSFTDILGLLDEKPTATSNASSTHKSSTNAIKTVKTPNHKNKTASLLAGLTKSVDSNNTKKSANAKVSSVDSTSNKQNVSGFKSKDESGSKQNGGDLLLRRSSNDSHAKSSSKTGKDSQSSKLSSSSAQNSTNNKSSAATTPPNSYVSYKESSSFMDSILGGMSGLSHKHHKHRPSTQRQNSVEDKSSPSSPVLLPPSLANPPDVQVKSENNDSTSSISTTKSVNDFIMANNDNRGKTENLPSVSTSHDLKNSEDTVNTSVEGDASTMAVKSTFSFYRDTLLDDECLSGLVKDEKREQDERKDNSSSLDLDSSSSSVSRRTRSHYSKVPSKPSESERSGSVDVLKSICDDEDDDMDGGLEGMKSECKSAIADDDSIKDSDNVSRDGNNDFMGDLSSTDDSHSAAEDSPSLSPSSQQTADTDSSSDIYQPELTFTKDSTLSGKQLKGILVYHRSSFTKKHQPNTKSIKWRDEESCNRTEGKGADESLFTVKYFELDESERVNVNRVKFENMRDMELRLEKDILNKNKEDNPETPSSSSSTVHQKIPINTYMQHKQHRQYMRNNPKVAAACHLGGGGEHKFTYNFALIQRWYKPMATLVRRKVSSSGGETEEEGDESSSHIPGSRSVERHVQEMREKNILQALYFNKDMTPPSPAEPTSVDGGASTSQKSSSGGGSKVMLTIPLKDCQNSGSKTTANDDEDDGIYDYNKCEWPKHCVTTVQPPQSVVVPSSSKVDNASTAALPSALTNLLNKFKQTSSAVVLPETINGTVNHQNNSVILPLSGCPPPPSTTQLSPNPQQQLYNPRDANTGGIIPGQYNETAAMSSGVGGIGRNIQPNPFFKGHNHQSALPQGEFNTGHDGHPYQQQNNMDGLSSQPSSHTRWGPPLEQGGNAPMMNGGRPFSSHPQAPQQMPLDQFNQGQGGRGGAGAGFPPSVNSHRGRGGGSFYPPGNYSRGGRGVGGHPFNNKRKFEQRYENEPRPNGPQQQQGGFPNSKPCTFWVNKGFCREGNNCRFAHIESMKNGNNNRYHPYQNHNKSQHHR